MEPETQVQPPAPEVTVAEALNDVIAVIAVEVRKLKNLDSRTAGQMRAMLAYGDFLRACEHSRAQVVMAILARKGNDSLGREDIRALVRQLAKLPAKSMAVANGAQPA